MKRFYFDVHDGGAHIDREGTVLRDENAARQEALRFAAALMGDASLAAALGKAWAVVLRHDTEVILRLDVRR